MRSNQGKTSLKRRRREASPMLEYDRLPAELRTWLASAILPWSPRSVRKAYKRALGRTRDKHLALSELDQLQRRSITRDARNVWDGDHPFSIEDLAR
ncbi:MAG: DUF6525 family protein [Pseudomonadota bacterium]